MCIVRFKFTAQMELQFLLLLLFFLFIMTSQYSTPAASPEILLSKVKLGEGGGGGMENLLHKLIFFPASNMSKPCRDSLNISEMREAGEILPLH